MTAQAEAPSPEGVILDVRDATRRFKGQDAIRDISFKVRAGEIVTIIGRSGAGKSTLLRCLCGLERPDEGSVILHGRDLTRLSRGRLERERRKIGLIFQHFNLLNHCTVADNIALPLKINGWKKAARTPRIEEMLALVGLQGFGNKYPSQLSGGQKQRVGIARALAAKPDLLLCDEATSALDPEATQSILKLLLRINKTLGTALVLITHEMDLVQKLGRRILVLDHGDLVADTRLLDMLPSREARLKPFTDELRVQAPEELSESFKSDTDGNGAVARIWFDNDEGNAGLLAELGRRFNVDAHLVRGGVFPIEHRNMGDMVVRLSGPDSAQALAHLRASSIDLEILGHVPAHR